MYTINNYMDNTKLIYEIFDNINNNQSSVIIGPTDGGKTWFIENELIPYLVKEGEKVCYINECLNNTKIDSNTDVIIADEFETFFDKENLEKRYLKDAPYYSKEYVEKVNACHKSLKNIKVPVIFVITRNDKEDIKYLLYNLREVDSGQKVTVFTFDRNKRVPQ